MTADDIEEFEGWVFEALKQQPLKLSELIVSLSVRMRATEIHRKVYANFDTAEAVEKMASEGKVLKIEYATLDRPNINKLIYFHPKTTIHETTVVKTGI